MIKNKLALRQNFEPPETLGQLGNLEVILANTKDQLRQAQKLRFQIFYKEMAARSNLKTQILRRDFDKFDKICDHLLVLDHSMAGAPKVVGTYRLLRQNIAERFGGFYSQSEFNVKPMLLKHPGYNFCELGRSCVLPEYRDKRTIELLWAGIWSYVRKNQIDALFGCASFPSADPQEWSLALSFLHHQARAQNEWHIEALPELFVDMRQIPQAELNQKQALKQMPPLIKGYLRLGASFATGAIIDHQFNTTDVLVILPIKDINPKYIDYYGAEGERHRAA